MALRTLILMVSVFVACAWSCSSQADFVPVAFTNGMFITNVSSFMDRKPVFYSYKTEGKDIRFFIVKIDGQVRSYFDLCHSCKARNLGYRADDSAIECRACKVRIPYDTLESGIGGCYPYHLEGREKDGSYLILKDNILKGLQYLSSAPHRGPLPLTKNIIIEGGFIISAIFCIIEV